jgi:hypothetical protein
MSKLRDIKVVLRSPDGHYLAGGPTEWEFTDNLEQAAVFDYLANDIERHLESIRTSHGLELEALHVASHELLETCDRCEGTVPPRLAFFTGNQFLCPGCSGNFRTRLA